MARTSWMCLFGLLAAAAVAMAALQEPVPPARPAPPPAHAAPLPVVEEPFVAPVPRLDLPGRTTPRDVLEGFWELRHRFVRGQTVDPGHGYMAIGRRHLLVQFLVPGEAEDVPLLRAGAYTWQRLGERDSIRMTMLAGHFNEANGDVKLEVPGATQTRWFEIVGSALRVHQEGGDWLEFARIE